ncbi:MAG: preprotein translocase subunit SecG [Candidatus Marinimicrobia bacterium]|nr:preprotein translocase subunit SecG [Candidatus Neomarinimicrobiota bacterium]
MYTFLIILHIIVTILLIITVLMQTDKGNSLGGTFGSGGMGGGNLFGARTAASMLSKFTTGLAVAFFAITFLITLSSGPGSQTQNKSVISERANRNTAPAANLPAPQGDLPAQSGSPQQQPNQMPQQQSQQTESSN